MNLLLNKLFLLVSRYACRTDNKYLQDCVDDFYFVANNCGFNIEWHWMWLRLPVVKNVKQYEKVIKDVMRVHPMGEVPTGLSFNLTIGEEE